MAAATKAPRLTALTLDGYRCFGAPQRLELKPITLLYGRNSAGKSAVLRALAILTRSVAEAAKGPWDMGDEDGPGLGASFLSLPWRGRPNNRRFSFTLEWDDAGRQVVDRFSLEQDDHRAPAYVRSVVPDAGEGPETGWRREPSNNPLQHEYRDPDDTLVALQFTGLVPTSEGQHPLLDALANRLRGLRGQVQWLHGGRSRMERITRSDGTVPGVLEPTGEDAGRKLMVRQAELMPAVARYYAAPRISRELRWGEPIGDSARLLLPPTAQPSWPLELADVGEGMAKVLPVLVAAVSATSGLGPAILTVEDPDVHLHDDAIRALAEYLADLVAGARPGVVFVLETHSRTFALAIQNCVREGVLSPDQVGLVWANQQAEGRARLDVVPLSQKGLPQNNLMRDAFSEDGELAALLADLSPILAE
jgi:hypothetical protein